MILRQVWQAVFFVCAYVALDHASFIHSLNALNITPWNPPPGLGLALLLVVGPRAVPLVFAATLLADSSVRGLPHPIWASMAADAAVVLSYAAAAKVLRRFCRFNADLGGLRDVMILLAATVAAASLAGLGYVGFHLLGGLIPPSLFSQAYLRYWVGDLIGIAVFTPALLLFRTMEWPPTRVMAEAAAQGLALAAALWLVFGLGGAENFQFFYLLFPPLIWAATRFGLKGAAAANLAAQLGLIAVFSAEDAAIVVTFQALMLALATVTLVLGAAISERRRIQAELHSRQEELAQVARLSTAGEMAAVLAHELNQPLLAAIAFTRGAQRLLTAETTDTEKVRGALDRAVAESQRAGDIVRSLREFIGTGRSARAPAQVMAIIAEALAVVRPECAQRGIRLVVGVDKALPSVHVDTVQMSQVVLNLVRNGMDALDGGGEIAVAAEETDGMVVVEIADTGPGLSDEVAGRLFQPFNTSKAAGMGLGLSICRSLVEAHGGSLWLERSGGEGTAFRFSLPVAEESQERR